MSFSTESFFLIALWMIMILEMRNCIQHTVMIMRFYNDDYRLKGYGEFIPHTHHFMVLQKSSSNRCIVIKKI